MLKSICRFTSTLTKTLELMKRIRLIFAACMIWPLLLSANTLNNSEADNRVGGGATTNYMSNWDGGGATGTGSEPNNFGWDCTPSVTWTEANVFGIRFQDSITYSYNGGSLLGRLLFVRWDGVGGSSASSVYSYPATLEACKTYVFTAKIGWHNNGTAPAYSFQINTQPDNSGTSLAKDEYTVPSKEVFHDISLTFSTSSAGTYYFTLGASNAVLGAIRDLSVVAYDGLPFIHALEEELVYDSINLSNTFKLNAHGLTNDVTFTGPSGMSFTPSTVTAGDAACGIDVVAKFDTPGDVASGKIYLVSDATKDSISIRKVLPPWMAEGVDTLSDDGTWCWFQDPRAVYYEGTKKQTYTGWITSKGKVEVASYNHETGEVITKQISPSDFTQIDDHNNPTIMVREDGRILVSYSGHFYGPMRVIVSTNPEDITSFGAEANFGSNVTYANPYQIGDSTVMFYRDGDSWHPTMNVSTDGGITWGTPQEFITRDGYQQRPYAKYTQDSKGGMHITFTTGHPRQEANNKVYYVYYINKKFYKADGTFIKDFNSGTDALNIDSGEAEVVYDASAGKGWTWDIALDEEESPVILYAAFPDDNNHHYYYATWDKSNSKWVSNHIVNSGKWFPQTPEGAGEPEPNYSGGMVLDPNNPSIVYLSKQVNGVFEIFKYVTNDKGATWETEAITENTPADMINVRPVIPRGHLPGSFDVIWMRGKYVTYSNFLTSVMYYSPGTNPNSIKIIGSETKDSNSPFVFPNPTTGSVNVDLNQFDIVESVSVVNLLGSVVYKYSDVNEQKKLSLDLSNLNDGLYFIRLNDINNKAVATMRLIKK